MTPEQQEERTQALVSWFVDNQELLATLSPKCQLVIHLGEKEFRVVINNEAASVSF